MRALFSCSAGDSLYALYLWSSKHGRPLLVCSMFCVLGTRTSEYELLHTSYICALFLVRIMCSSRSASNRTGIRSVRLRSMGGLD